MKRKIIFAKSETRFGLISLKNKTGNCEKSQVNAKNRRPCDFCDFLQAHEKLQSSQLRANVDISEKWDTLPEDRSEGHRYSN